MDPSNSGVVKRGAYGIHANLTHAFGTINDQTISANISSGWQHIALTYDGNIMILYLNGTEIYRTNMPTGPITYVTFTSGGGTPDENAFFETSVDPGLLVNGTNVLAVEIHQRNLTSSDISFDLKLSTD